MQVIGRLFYLFGAIDFFLWLVLDINLTHTSWSPLAAGLLGRACIAFGAVNATDLRRVAVPTPDGVDLVDRGAASQAQAASDFSVTQAVTSAV